MTKFLVLCRDRVSLCRDIVLRLKVVVRSQHRLSSRDSVLFLCRDNVATEVSFSRPRRPRQEVRCRTFHAATGFSQDVKFLCCDRVFYVAT